MCRSAHKSCHTKVIVSACAVEATLTLVAAAAGLPTSSGNLRLPRSPCWILVRVYLLDMKYSQTLLDVFPGEEFAQVPNWPAL